MEMLEYSKSRLAHLQESREKKMKEFEIKKYC